MPAPTRRTTVYFDPDLHHALRLKASSTQRSVSDIVSEAVREALREDEADLAAFEERGGQATLNYEELFAELQAHGEQ